MIGEQIINRISVYVSVAHCLDRSDSNTLHDGISQLRDSDLKNLIQAIS